MATRWSVSYTHLDVYKRQVDEGVYHELLLDAFDYNGDGVAEIFTYTQSFEGSGFSVYNRDGGKWTKVFDGSNYHCGY